MKRACETENLDNAAALLRSQARRFILRADAAPRIKV
jgi:hypothetical protein